MQPVNAAMAWKSVDAGSVEVTSINSKTLKIHMLFSARIPSYSTTRLDYVVLEYTYDIMRRRGMSSRTVPSIGYE
jgi:hypothetical protein